MTALQRSLSLISALHFAGFVMIAKSVPTLALWWAFAPFEIAVAALTFTVARESVQRALRERREFAERCRSIESAERFEAEHGLATRF